MRFTEWMYLADEACYDLVGVSIYDLPDTESHDAWAGGETPREFAVEALETAGFEPRDWAIGLAFSYSPYPRYYHPLPYE